MSDRAEAPAKPDWTPTQQDVERSNIAWLMREAGVANYQKLHAWSAKHRDRYWALAVARLGVRFYHPPTTTLDMTRGAENPQWFAGGKLNIAESCFHASGDSTAIIYQAEDGPLNRMSLDTLQRLSSQVAHALTARGIGAGDAVAMALPMTAESVAAYLGIIRAGAAVVGIADSFSSAEMGVRLRIGKARLVFTQDVILRGGKRHELYPRVRAAGDCPAVVISGEETQNMKLADGDCGWNDFLSGGNDFSSVERAPDDTLNILFSSGTTGEPKAIPWTHLCPIKCAADAHFHHDVQPGEVLAWPTSLGWMMGPWLIFASLMNRAAMALYYGAPTDRGFGEFVQRAGVNMLGVVPSLVAAWRGNRCLEGLDWTGIRRFSSTGECSRPDDMRWLMQRAGGRPVIEYCGGTEVSGGYITGTMVQPCYASTFSTPALGMDLVMLDEQGQPGDRGELFLIPPSIGMSTRLLNRDHHEIYYQNCPQGPGGETLRRHGDELERLPNGYWRALGRVDDTMNLGGIKVSSAEIERVVNRVDGVSETAAVAEAPDDGGPSQLIIYAVMKTNGNVDELRSAMQQAIRRELNPLFKIHRVELVTALPRTASNKVMRRMLRRGTS